MLCVILLLLKLVYADTRCCDRTTLAGDFFGGNFARLFAICSPTYCKKANGSSVRYFGTLTGVAHAAITLTQGAVISFWLPFILNDRPSGVTCNTISPTMRGTVILRDSGLSSDAITVRTFALDRVD
jgi:hypothetical protein